MERSGIRDRGTNIVSFLLQITSDSTLLGVNLSHGFAGTDNAFFRKAKMTTCPNFMQLVGIVALYAVDCIAGYGRIISELNCTTPQVY